MTKKVIDLNIENKNASWTYISLILTSLCSMALGFMVVKITIMLYGEPINGIVRFLTQIFAYIFIMLNSISMAFSIKIIKYYRESKWNHIIWINKYIKKMFNYFTLIYLIIILITGILVSRMLSTIDINPWFIYAIFMAIGTQSLTYLFAFKKYDLFYTSINKGYVTNFTSVFFKVLFFAYFLIIAITFPPKLETIISPTTKHPILTFVSGDKRIYNIVFALFMFSINPIFAGILLSFKYKKDKARYTNIMVPSDIVSEKDKNNFKKSVWKSTRFALILSMLGLVTTNTDEFVILILKNGTNDDYILKMISIYGLYSSMVLSVFTIMSNYVSSKRTVIGLTHENSIERSEYIQKIRIKTYWIALLGIAICVLTVPILINFLFNPTSNEDLYLNINFSLPISILCALGLIYKPTYLMLEVDNRFHYLAIFSASRSIDQYHCSIY